MGSYQKADGITLSQLNNTEYTNFMNRVLTLLTAGSISKLTVTNIVNSIKPKLVQMEDLVNRSTANAETKDLLKLDAERFVCQLFVGYCPCGQKLTVGSATRCI